MPFNAKTVLALSAAALTIFSAPYIASKADAAESEVADSLSDEQKAAINDMVHQFIMNNPEVLLESVELYQQRKEEEKQNAAKQAAGELVADIKSGSVVAPIVGDLEAELMVVEFLDYNCGFCRRGFETVQSLMEDESKSAQIAFIELPVLGQSSVQAAKYALAAKMQGKYFEFHSALFERPGPKSVNKFIEIAESLELDIDKLKADADGADVQKILDDNRALADKLQISGTPAFIVGSDFVPGYIDYNRMKSIIDSQSN